MLIFAIVSEQLLLKGSYAEEFLHNSFSNLLSRVLKLLTLGKVIS
ncbi:hypothetical protein HMPREF1869_00979 [Bacteroidales bacterium KA00251]|nr:hypothetical protein HMPREF1869_00979 [Bacteroidales bacterium KA00251]